MDPGVPLCPPQGATLLPDSYPAMAVTVSDDSGGSRFVKDVVTKILKAQSDKPPQFFLQVTDGTFYEVEQAVRALPASPEVKKQWLSSLTQVAGTPWVWQQDFYQSYVNPKTGMPVPRELGTYLLREDLSGRSVYRDYQAEIESECGIAPGSPVPAAETAFNGYSGGNIEGGPAGLCFLGRDSLEATEHARYAKQVCGNAEVLAVPTDFLLVGHSDEVVSTWRTGPGPCDFVVGVASPKAAYDVLNRDGGEPAFAAITKDSSLDEMYSVVPLEICDRLAELRHKAKPAPQPKGPAPALPEGGWLRKLLLPDAYAGFSPDSDSEAEAAAQIEEERKQTAECGTMNNRELAESVRQHAELGPLNEKVERDMQAFKARLIESWRRKTPQCTPKVIDLPALFTGRWIKQGGLAEEGRSLFPNAANIQQFGRTILAPDPGNSALKKDFANRVAAAGLSADFIDTRFAHEIGGNLHCTTNTLRYCRPAAGVQ